MRQIGDIAVVDGIGDRNKNNRERGRLLRQYLQRRRRLANDHIRLQVDELFGGLSNPIHLSDAEAEGDLDIAAIFPAEAIEAILESGHAGLRIRISLRIPHQHADATDTILLRAHRA